MKPPPRQPMSAAELRAEAVRIARQCARDRHDDDDPEGATVIYELADCIARIKLLKPKETDR